jgi:hypothetical protein
LLLVRVLGFVIFHVTAGLQLLRENELGRIIEVGRDVIDGMLAPPHQHHEQRDRDQKTYHSADQCAVPPGATFRPAGQEDCEETHQRADDAQQEAER